MTFITYEQNVDNVLAHIKSLLTAPGAKELFASGHSFQLIIPPQGLVEAAWLGETPSYWQPEGAGPNSIIEAPADCVIGTVTKPPVSFRLQDVAAMLRNMEQLDKEQEAELEAFRKKFEDRYKGEVKVEFDPIVIDDQATPFDPPPATLCGLPVHFTEDVPKQGEVVLSALNFEGPGFAEACEAADRVEEERRRHEAWMKKKGGPK